MEFDVPGTLKDLEKVAQRIGALLEWNNLYQEEHGSTSLPPFVFGQKNQQEIADLYAQFGFLSMSSRMMLEESVGLFNSDQLQHWLQRLHHVERWVYELGTMEKFIKD